MGWKLLTHIRQWHYLKICIFLSLFSICNGRSIEYGTAKSTDWDMIIFSQQWPITRCIDHTERHPGASCSLYKNMTGTWTVHGLWPTLAGTRGPTFCNTSWPFVEAKVADIESNLVKYWTNIYADTGKLSLWQHEWKKHGTCAALLPQLGNEHKYFSKGLQWVMNYDLERGLRNRDIVPSSTASYTSQQVFDALTSLYNTDPIVDCIYDHDKKRQLLSQIKLCFNRQLELVSCEKAASLNGLKVVRGRGNCPEKGIIYPDSVSYAGKVFKHGPKPQPDPILASEAARDNRKKPECTTPLCQALFAVYALNITPL